MVRRVVLICGPPGSGKTTLARSLKLEVYDIDDPRWGGSEAMFRRALKILGANPNARAAVIRSGATQSARTKVAAVIRPTDTQVLDVPRDECIRRVVERNRPRPPLRAQIAAVDTWWSKHVADGAPRGATIREW